MLSTVVTFYFLKHDPGLVEGRLKAGPAAEHEKSQKIIQTLTVKVQPGQSVISTGPYSIVRHPMYSGGVLMILATPLALGSIWAFVCAVLLCGMIAARLLDEERYLSRNLPGYEDYCRKVRYRVIPHVW